MDKNFIKIDDLFRQRLSGAEERERGGAWLNMRDLLDKEMPQQKRIGIFYWRRLFNAVAVLSLIGTVCIGSYELSSAYKKQDADIIPIADASAVNREGNAGNNFEISATDTESAGFGLTVSNNTSRVPTAKRPKHRHIAKAGTAMGSETGTDANELAAAGNNNSTTVANAGAMSQGEHENLVAEGNETARNNQSNQGASSVTGNSASNTSKNSSRTKNTSTVSYNNDVASNNSTFGNSGKTDGTNSAAIYKNAGANRIVHSSGNTNGSKLNSSNKNARPLNGNTENGTGLSGTTPSNNGRSGINGRRHPHSNTNAGTGNAGSKQQAGNSLAVVEKVNTSAPLPLAATPSGDRASHKVAPARLPASVASQESGTTGEESANSMKTASANSGKGGVRNSSAKNKSSRPLGTGGAASKNAETSASSVAKSSETTAGKPLGTGGVALKSTEEEKPTGKRMITKLLVHQRKIKIADDLYSYQLDTISMEKVNMDMGTAVGGGSEEDAIAEEAPKSKRGSGHGVTPGKKSASNNDEERTAAAGNEPAHGAKAGKAKGTANKSGSNTLSDNAGEDDADATGGVYSSSASASSSDPATAGAAATADMNTTETDTKTKPAASKKHSGMSLIRKLSLAFNDVKHNAGDAKFATGITAGINSNFFGANSFKGFQFGLTGNIIFNDTWNLMTELKYFHRLNNNTSIEDNFYTYTAVGSQYRKDLQMNSYSFSALHSIEMPVAIRYSMGNFNFYTGGNFLYSFSLNTGASTMPAISQAPVYVNEQGTDNAPKIKESDFNSRLGIGYLFGFNYQVAPNLSLDLRSVQTVWDNATSTGAKSISGQLYRTPSVQLSIMYRLGGRRSKD